MRIGVMNNLISAFALLLCALIVAVGAGPAYAQDAALDVGAADYEALDAQNRESSTALEAYGRVAEAQKSSIDMAQSNVTAFRQKMVAIFSAASNFWPLFLEGLSKASPTQDAWYFAGVLLYTALGLLIGYVVVERLIYVQFFAKPLFVGHLRAEPQGYVEKLPILALRVLLTCGGVLLTCFTSLGLGLIAHDADQATQKTSLVILATYAAIRAAGAVWRMVLAPYLSEYRIPNLSDAAARSLYAWMWWGAAFGLSALSICMWVEALQIDARVHILLTAALTLMTVIISLAMIRCNHAAITSAIRGGRTQEHASYFARAAGALWPTVAAIYFIGSWIVSTYRLIMEEVYGLPLIIGAYVILTVILIVYGVVSYMIEWIFERRAAVALIEQDLSDDFEAPQERYRMRTMRDLARRVASVLAMLAGVWALLWIWRVDAWMMEEGARLSILFDLFITGFIGYVAYHAVRIAIEKKIEEEGGEELIIEPGDEGGGAASASRLATLLPLFRNFLLVTILVVTVMMMLLESGLNVTPLFAGAGVVGLAIGFGAQTLVRDIFSGAFFLIDDAFRKGEYIDIGDVKGTVEKVSLRSFQLRHHLGMLHTVPFGEIQYLTNFSRDWVMMKLPLRLTYDTDVEHVRKLIKRLGQSLLDDPVIGDKFLQPLKSQGVYQMEDSAMILRVKFMTKPGEQWVVRKRVYAEIRALFEREGVKFAHREVTVRLADGKSEELGEEEKKAISGATGPLLEQPKQPAVAGAADDR